MPSPFSTCHAELLNLANLSLSLLILSAFTASCGSKVCLCLLSKETLLSALGCLSPTAFIKWPPHSCAAGFAESQFIYHICDFIISSPTFPHVASVQNWGSHVVFCFFFLSVPELWVCSQLGYLCSVCEHSGCRRSPTLWCWTPFGLEDCWY